jgi:3-hydroxyacyl-CoA dehydrogenase/enoyl-CoA hydratase/carnithine racemase
MSQLFEKVATTVAVDEELSAGGNRVLVLTLTAEEPERPAVLGPRGLENLDGALDDVLARIAAGGIAAVVVRGSGRAFCAGADLDMMSSITERSVSLALAETGHRVLGRLSRLGVPSIAEINGVALGGGLELALHCTFRIASASVSAIGLPEISLGLIPGWGGSTLLPRLVGLASATTVLLDNPVKGNALLNSTQALHLGIIDRVVDDAKLRDASLQFVDEGFPVDRTEHVTSAEDLSALKQKCAALASRPGNPIVAIGRLLEIVEQGTTIGSGFAAEDDALAELILTAEFRNRVYAFHLTTSRARKPAGVPAVEARTVSHVGIIGAGLMASQFAALFAEKLDCSVIVTDVSQERLDAALERISDALNSRVERGSLSADKRASILANLTTTLDHRDFAGCDFVMEAVFEDLAVKVDVLREIETHVSADCILATNTSSLSVTDMATALQHPERLIGFHFFNPVAVMPLVEVVATPHTADESIATAIACAGRLRKTAVIVKDVPGFVVNRILSVFLSTTLDYVDNGLSPASVSTALEPLRLPMDPFALIDLIGRPVTLHMLESLHAFAPQRVLVSPALREATENPVTDSVARDCDTEVSANVTEQQDINTRVLDDLAREIAIMLDEGVVAAVEDIDLCLIAGAGWPVAHGGISRYLDEVGASERSNGRRFH